MDGATEGYIGAQRLEIEKIINKIKMILLDIRTIEINHYQALLDKTLISAIPDSKFNPPPPKKLAPQYKNLLKQLNKLKIKIGLDYIPVNFSPLERILLYDHLQRMQAEELYEIFQTIDPILIFDRELRPKESLFINYRLTNIATSWSKTLFSGTGPAEVISYLLTEGEENLATLIRINPHCALMAIHDLSNTKSSIPKPIIDAITFAALANPNVALALKYIISWDKKIYKLFDSENIKIIMKTTKEIPTGKVDQLASDMYNYFLKKLTNSKTRRADRASHFNNFLHHCYHLSPTTGRLSLAIIKPEKQKGAKEYTELLYNIINTYDPAVLKATAEKFYQLIETSSAKDEAVLSSLFRRPLKSEEDTLTIDFK